MSSVTAPMHQPLRLRRAGALARPPAVRPAAVRPPAVRPRMARVRWDRIAAVLAALMLLVWLLAAGMAGRSDAGAVALAPVEVVVQPGDTVWDMAREHGPAGMVTLEYVMLVEQHNDVRSGALIPGTLLRLPQFPG